MHTHLHVLYGWDDNRTEDPSNIHSTHSSRAWCLFPPPPFASNLNIEMNIGWVGGAPVGTGMGERFDQSLHKCVCAGDKQRSPPAASQHVVSDTLLIRQRLE